MRWHTAETKNQEHDRQVGQNARPNQVLVFENQVPYCDGVEARSKSRSVRSYAVAEAKMTGDTTQ